MAPGKGSVRDLTGHELPPPWPDGSEEQADSRAKIKKNQVWSANASRQPPGPDGAQNMDVGDTNLDMGDEIGLVEMGKNGSNSNSPKSFRDSLMNSKKRGGLADKDVNVILRDDDIQIDCNGKVTRISFSERVHDIIAENMKSTIFVKVLGRAMGYRALHNHLTRIWQPSGIFTMADVGNNYFMIRFGERSDYFKTVTDRPWMILGHYLMVQPWTSSFDPTTHVFSYVVAWIRLPNLPVHFYLPGVLKAVAGVIGDVIRIDQNTASSARGKYARVAVNLDLTKPLESKLEIEGRMQLIEYEGLPDICFHCGMYGHVRADCVLVEEAAQTNVDIRDSIVEQIPLEKVDREHIGDYGPWMQVTKKGIRNNGGKGRRLNEQNNKIKQALNRGPLYNELVHVGGFGSRFESLQDVEVEANDVGKTVVALEMEVGVEKNLKRYNRVKRSTLDSRENNEDNRVTFKENVNLGVANMVESGVITLENNKSDAERKKVNATRVPIRDITNETHGLHPTDNTMVILPPPGFILKFPQLHVDDQPPPQHSAIVSALDRTGPNKKKKEKAGILLSKQVRNLKIRKKDSKKPLSEVGKDLLLSDCVEMEKFECDLATQGMSEIG